MVRSVLSRAPAARPAAIVENTPPDLIFDVVRWPEIILVANHVEACDDGWTASAFVVVRGTKAPVTLHVRPVAAMQDGGRRVEATGVLDLRTTPIRAPRALIGRYVEISVECVLRPPSRTT